MTHRPAAIVVVVLVATACSAPSAAGTPSPPAIVAASAASTATRVPATSAPATAVPSASPAASATPPEATLSVEGGDPVVGQLGTYTWADGGSDSPWLTGTPIKAATGEALTVNLDGGVGIAGWTVKRVVAGHEGGSGTTGLASGSGAPVTFAAPPNGSWSVQVTIQFAGDLGSASYYWRVDVK